MIAHSSPSVHAMAMALIVLAAVMAQPGDVSRASGSRLRAFRVSGSSMMPALRPGETIVVDRMAYAAAPPEAGDIVAFRLKTRDRPLVKRVIAAAGDLLEFSQEGMIRNGAPLTSPGLRAANSGDFRILRLQLSRMVGRVPPGSVVVAGDNPASEEDSRQYGLVSVTQLIGKVVLVREASGALIKRPGLPESPAAPSGVGQEE